MRHEFSVPHYPWRDSASRVALAFNELRRVSKVERECFASQRVGRDQLERRALAAILQEAQRVWRLASREYTAALSDYIASLHGGAVTGRATINAPRAAASSNAGGGD